MCCWCCWPPSSFTLISFNWRLLLTTVILLPFNRQACQMHVCTRVFFEKTNIHTYTHVICMYVSVQWRIVFICAYLRICAFTRLKRAAKASRLNARIDAKYLLPTMFECVYVCVRFHKTVVNVSFNNAEITFNRTFVMLIIM